MVNVKSNSSPAFHRSGNIPGIEPGRATPLSSRPSVSAPAAPAGLASRSSLPGGQAIATLAPRKKLANVGKLVAASVGLGAGPAAQRSDAVAAFQKAQGAIPSGKTNAAPADPKALAAADLALQTLHESSPAVDQATDKAVQQLTSSALGFAASADPDDTAKLSAALEHLLTRLNHGTPPKPDALGAAVVAETAAQLFGPSGSNDMKAALSALRGLADTNATDLLAKISSSISLAQPDGDPTLSLVAALAAAQGGQERLTKLMGDKSGTAEQQEALFVGAKAWQTTQAAGPEMKAEEREVLKDAVTHAMRQANPGADAGATDEQLRRGRVAYQSVRNGMTERGEGSDFQQANKWLDKFGGQWLNKTAERNIRAQKFYGGFVNTATALLPHTSKTVPFRKTALLQAASAAAGAGLLPHPSGAVRTLDSAAGTLLKTFGALEVQRRTSGEPASKETLILEGLIKTALASLTLGDNPLLQSLPDDIPGGRELPDLHVPTLALVAMRASTDFSSLGPAFKAEWAALEGSRPNVGHVLLMLTEHLLASQAPGRPEQVGRSSLVQRGERSDKLSLKVVESLGDVVEKVNRFAATPDGSSDPHLTDLARVASETHEFMQSLQPTWRLQNIKAEQFAAMEDRIGATTFSALPERFHAEWEALKGSGGSAGDLASLMNRALYDAIARTPSPASEDKSAVSHALILAQDSFVNAVADSSVRRFDEAVADIVTTYGDLRSPRDLSAMMESAVRRMDLDDRLSMTDNRASGINASPLLANMPVPLVAFVAEAFKQMDRTIDINTHGNTLQMFVGQADGAHVKGGVTLDALKLIPLSKSTTTALEALGVSIEVNAGVEHARNSNHGAGVTLRLENDDPESLRRQFGAVINDLAQSSLMVGEGMAYEDVLSLLLDRHDDLSVCNSKTEDKAHMGKTFAHAGAKLDAMSHLGVSVPAGLPVPGQLSLSAQVDSHSQRAKNSRSDQTGILQVSEFTIQAKHNIDGTLTAMSSPLTKGLYKSGGSHTLSVVSKDGAVQPGSTRTTQHFSSHKAFEKAIKAEQQSWTQALVDSDTTVGRSDADKLAAAEIRLAQLLDDSKTFDTVTASGRGRLEGDFQLIRELKLDAAKVWNDLEAKAQLAADNGDEPTAGALRARIGELANDPRNWMPVDLLGGKRFTSEGGQAVPVLEVRRAGGTGLATHMESSLINSSWIRA